MKRLILGMAFVLLTGLGVMVYFHEKGASGSVNAAVEHARGSQNIDAVVQKNLKHGSLVFYIRNGQIANLEYVKKTFTGWKWVYGGGQSLPGDKSIRAKEGWSYQYLPDPGNGPFPLLFGAIQNPEVTSLTVRDLGTGVLREAEILKGSSSIRYWYIEVDADRGQEFLLQSRSKDGALMNEVRYKD